MAGAVPGLAAPPRRPAARRPARRRLRDRARPGSGPGTLPAGAPVATRFQVTCFGLGAFAMLLAAEWPMHDLAEGYLYSVHMVQHLTLTMVAAPLLLLGTPGWLARWLLRPRVAVPVRPVAVPVHPGPDPVQRRDRARPLAGDGGPDPPVRAGPTSSPTSILLLSAFIVWMPIVSPLPEIPRLVAPAADGLPVPAVRGADDPGFVSHFRESPAVSSLRVAAEAVGDLRARRPAHRRTDHEDRGRPAAVGADRGDLLPLGSRGGAPEPAGTRDCGIWTGS